ncbi:histidine-containing phosphotransfer protein 1-like [Populus alba x Populus x berolinensis]|nr:histidine-containing phosphotransfer protein 1-like [Populus alba x Populus x berolinensis]
MDSVVQLQRQLVDYRAQLFNEGFLDEQFTNFNSFKMRATQILVEVVTLFFEDSERLLDELAKALEQQSVDYRKIDAHVHQLKGSSSSIGAQRVQKVCIGFRNFCEERNIEGCQKCLQQVKHEYSLVKTKLETLSSLSKRSWQQEGQFPYQCNEVKNIAEDPSQKQQNGILDM